MLTKLLIMPKLFVILFCRRIFGIMFFNVTLKCFIFRENTPQECLQILLEFVSSSEYLLMMLYFETFVFLALAVKQLRIQLSTIVNTCQDNNFKFIKIMKDGIQLEKQVHLNNATS